MSTRGNALKQKAKARLTLRLRAVRLLSLGEAGFADVLAAAEGHPLFARLRPCLRRAGFPRSSFYLPRQGSEASDRGAIDWAAHARELASIRRMGQEAFERHFLLEEGGSSAEEIAGACGVSVAETRSIQAFLLTAALQHQASAKAPASRPRASICLARVVLGEGKPAIQWALPHLARGLYRIDYDAVSRVMASLPSAEDRRRARELLGSLESINLRQDALWRTLELIVKTQGAFFAAGRRAALVPLPPSHLAGQLGIHPSTAGRLAEGRSLLAPWDEELPLRSLLPNRRQCAVFALREFLASAGPAPGSDRELQGRLKRDFDLALSRRSVNECRHAARESGYA